MHASHPSSMMVPVDDNIMHTFPIIQVEVKIRVPDQLIGRLIGKNGVCLKKIMDDTSTHIIINDSRNQHEIQSYQNPDFFDRVITIKGSNINTVLLAEKNVQQKLRQFVDQDLNNAGQQQYYSPPGVIVNPVENIGTYIAPGSVPTPMIPRDNAYPTATYNAIPIGVNPQSFYIQTQAAVPNFSISTGQYGAHNAVPSVPPTMQQQQKSVHIKSRVYVPNNIVGILIGTKGQTIKSVIADSGAIIIVEGDRDHPRKMRKEIDMDNKETNSSNNSKEGHQEGCDKLDMKSMADTEPIVNDKNGEDSSPKKTETDEANGVVKQDGEEKKEVATEGVKEQNKEKQDVNGSQPHNSLSTDTHHQHSQEPSHFNGNKKNNGINPIGIEQRGVFIQGYDYQVNKALYWVFQKVSENQNNRPDEIVLTCEAIVPCKVIGRIIGKQGQNVKQLQMRSGAQIKVPDDINQTDKSSMETAVRIVGNFYAIQMVQHHFGTLIMDAEWRESKEYDERRSRYREGSR